MKRFTFISILIALAMLIAVPVVHGQYGSGGGGGEATDATQVATWGFLREADIDVPDSSKMAGWDFISANVDEDLRIIEGHKLYLGDASLEHENVIHNPVFLSGQEAGLNDVSSSGIYVLEGNAVFQIRIESTGTPDNFVWRKGTSGVWSSPVAMKGSSQLLQDGISITWAVTTGHTLDDVWEMNTGHEVHVSEAIHINAGLTVDEDLVVAGALRSLSPVKIAGGISLVTKPEISTDEATLSFSDATPGTKTLAELAASAVDYNSVTGWREGGQKTINAGDDTKIDIAPGSAQIVDYSDPLNPVSKIISWGQQTALDPALASWTKWVGVKDDGFGEAEFVYQVAFFDEVQRRTIAPLGKVRDQVSGTGPHITNIDVFPRPSHGLLRAFQDFILVFGSFSISGNDVYANGADLLVSKSAGKSYRYNVESVIGHENIHNDAPQTPVSDYTYYVQGSYETTSLTAIDPNNMDNGAQGTKPVSGGNTYTRQEWYFWPKSGVCNFMYGQTEYTSLQGGIDAGKEPLLGVTAIMLDGSIHIASIVIKQGTTEIQPAIDAGTARIIPAGGMGGGAGGGGISNIAEDTTPQLGGNLDVQTFAIEATGINPITFDTDGSERMRIGGQGNVTIKEVSMGSELSINGSKTSALEAQIWNLLGTDINAHAKLSLISTDATGGDPYITFDIANVVGTWSLGVDNSDGDKFKIGTSVLLGLADLLVIDRNGNVGIGTNAPDRMLHIKGSDANFHLERESPFGATFFFSNVDGANTTHWKMEAVNNGAGSGNGVFTIADDGTGSGGASTTRLIIDENGNVGIGTETPTSKLHVVGLPVYANNAAAITGGLTVGAFYRTGADPDPVCVVH